MNRIKVTLFFSLLTTLMATMRSTIGGTSGTAYAFIIALGMNFSSYCFSNIFIFQKYGVLERHNQGKSYQQNKLLFRGIF
ncbi:MAG: hypothetical protein V1844_18585 [Pseudomonadota bacterium]